MKMISNDIDEGMMPHLSTDLGPEKQQLISGEIEIANKINK
jgi:hypothetical protein